MVHNSRQFRSTPQSCERKLLGIESRFFLKIESPCYSALAPCNRDESLFKPVDRL